MLRKPCFYFEVHHIAAFTASGLTTSAVRAMFAGKRIVVYHLVRLPIDFKAFSLVPRLSAPFFAALFVQALRGRLLSVSIA
jgi:hypothetical protein